MGRSPASAGLPSERERALAEPAEEPDHHQTEGDTRQGDVLDLIRHRAVQVEIAENRNQVGHQPQTLPCDIGRADYDLSHYGQSQTEQLQVLDHGVHGVLHGAGGVLAHAGDEVHLLLHVLSFLCLVTF